MCQSHYKHQSDRLHAFFLLHRLDLPFYLGRGSCADRLAVEGTAEKQEHAGRQHYVNKDVDCEFLAAVNLKQRNIVGERHTDLAYRL